MLLSVWFLQFGLFGDTFLVAKGPVWIACVANDSTVFAISHARKGVCTVLYKAYTRKKRRKTLGCLTSLKIGSNNFEYK